MRKGIPGLGKPFWHSRLWLFLRSLPVLHGKPETMVKICDVPLRLGDLVWISDERDLKFKLPEPLEVHLPDTAIQQATKLLTRKGSVTERPIPNVQEATGLYLKGSVSLALKVGTCSACKATTHAQTQPESEVQLLSSALEASHSRGHGFEIKHRWTCTMTRDTRDAYIQLLMTYADFNKGYSMVKPRRGTSLLVLVTGVEHCLSMPLHAAQ